MMPLSGGCGGELQNHYCLDLPPASGAAFMAHEWASLLFLSSQQLFLLHQKQRECSSSQWGVHSPSSPLLLPVGSQQPSKPQAWHRVESAALLCSQPRGLSASLLHGEPPITTKEPGVSEMSLLEAGRAEESRLLLSPLWQPLWLSRAASRLLTQTTDCTPPFTFLFVLLEGVDYPPSGFLSFQG